MWFYGYNKYVKVVVHVSVLYRDWIESKTTENCGFQTIIWIHLVFLIYFTLKLYKHNQNNQPQKIACYPPLKTYIHTWFYNLLLLYFSLLCIWSFYSLYKRYLASFTFVLLPIVIICRTKIFEHIRGWGSNSNNNKKISFSSIV